VSEVVKPEAELTRLYHSDYERLVRTLGVAFDPHDAADAVQDAYLAAFKRWKAVVAYDDPIGWIRRVTVTLFYLEDLSGEEIAEVLGVSASTVRSNLADARARLRLELTEEIV
jgi:DNA-directed RNA polymerase specialized sigma24 family protein